MQCNVLEFDGEMLNAMRSYQCDDEKVTAFTFMFILFALKHNIICPE